MILRLSRVFLFPFVRTKEKETKRKSAGCRSEAKIFTFFLNKKNSLRSNSFLFLTEKCKNFFTLLHGGRNNPPRRAHRFAREFISLSSRAKQSVVKDFDFIAQPISFFAIQNETKCSEGSQNTPLPTSEAMLRKKQ